jgi:hypothetical protein
MAGLSAPAIEMLYFIVRENEGNLAFAAPWGEPIAARIGDVIVRGRISRYLSNCDRVISLHLIG